MVNSDGNDDGGVLFAVLPVAFFFLAAFFFAAFFFAAFFFGGGGVDGGGVGDDESGGDKSVLITLSPFALSLISMTKDTIYPCFNHRFFERAVPFNWVSLAKRFLSI